LSNGLAPGYSYYDMTPEFTAPVLAGGAIVDLGVLEAALTQGGSTGLAAIEKGGDVYVAYFTLTDTLTVGTPFLVKAAGTGAQVSLDSNGQWTIICTDTPSGNKVAINGALDSQTTQEVTLATLNSEPFDFFLKGANLVVVQGPDGQAAQQTSGNTQAALSKLVRATGQEASKLNLGDYAKPRMAPQTSGGSVVVWVEGNTKVMMQCFNEDCEPEGEPFLVDQIPQGAIASVDVQSRSDGQFLVAYTGVEGAFSQENLDQFVRVRQFDIRCRPVTDALTIASDQGLNGLSSVLTSVVITQPDPSQDGWSVLVGDRDHGRSFYLGQVNSNAQTDQPGPENGPLGALGELLYSMSTVDKVKPANTTPPVTPGTDEVDRGTIGSCPQPTQGSGSAVTDDGKVVNQAEEDSTCAAMGRNDITVVDGTGVLASTSVDTFTADVGAVNSPAATTQGSPPSFVIVGEGDPGIGRFLDAGGMDLGNFAPSVNRLQNPSVPKQIHGGRIPLVWRLRDLVTFRNNTVMTMLDFTGAQVVAEFQVNAGLTSANGSGPDVAMSPDGSLVAVVWSSGSDTVPSVSLRLFDNNGTPLSGDVEVPTVPIVDFLQKERVAVAPDKGVAVVYTADDGDGRGVFLRLFDATGSPLGAEVRVNTTTAADQNFPTLAFDSKNNLVVAWTSANQDGDGLGVYGQRYDANGAPVGGEFLLSQTTTGDQKFADVGFYDLGDGTPVMVATWIDQQAAGLPHLFTRNFLFP
ncbi:MAG: hypothetical protein KC910_27175, partial [Candidatus Eremiobacteraeota bacterium]|nr:hypothetical protein [Candidatus Eremiobacteraeota bacterium]